LRFDDHYGPAQAAGNGAGFFFCKRHFTVRSGNAVAGEDGFSLVFVNLHEAFAGAKIEAARKRASPPRRANLHAKARRQQEREAP